MFPNVPHSTRVIVVGCAALTLSALMPVKTGAQLDDYPPDGRYCTGTARALFEALPKRRRPILESRRDVHQLERRGAPASVRRGVGGTARWRQHVPGALTARR